MVLYFITSALILAPKTLADFSYDAKKQKYVQEQNYLSSENCFDYALFAKNNEEFRVIALCPQGYLIFNPNGTSEKIEFLASLFPKNFFILREKEYLWFLTEENGEKLYYLHPKGISEIRDFRSLEGGWLLFVQGRYFLLAPQEVQAQLISLLPFPESFQNPKSYWHFLSGGGFLISQGILALNFYIAGEKATAIYDTQEARWKLLPRELLYPEEIRALETGQNVLFRFPVPAGPNRYYFVIFQGNEEVGRTEIQNEGETAFFSLKVKPGRYLFQAKRYSSQQKGDSRKFLLEKNIFQAEPISVNLIFGSQVLIFLREGQKHEKKAFVLDYTYLPLP